MTVDEILAGHEYRDRRGRVWSYDPDFDVWVEYASLEDGILHLGWIVDTKDVRLVIERDQHRDECRGLRHCGTHPVPAVVSWTTPIGFPQYGAHWRGRHHYTGTLPEAMDAARALAVGE